MTSNANQGFNIYHNLVINASKEKIFDAVSNPKHLNNWWTKNCTGNPKVGETYNLNFTDEYDWYCQIIVCEPYDSFHLKMTKSNLDWDTTTFGFDMENSKNGVLVKFSHINWPKCNNHFKTASFCWAILLNGLKDYLEKGIIIPFEERN